jgi:hypothetical protein
LSHVAIKKWFDLGEVSLVPKSLFCGRLTASLLNHLRLTCSSVTAELVTWGTERMTCGDKKQHETSVWSTSKAQCLAEDGKLSYAQGLAEPIL